MMALRPKLKRFAGFTLIEIVLVLAMAAFILIVVLLAVGGAQKSRRDYERKQFVGLAAAAIDNFYANRHIYPDPQDPATVSEYEDNYLPKQADPLTGDIYSSDNGNFVYRSITSNHADMPPIGTIYVQYGHWCNVPGRPDIDNPSDPIAGNDVSPHDFVIWTRLESGGSFCADNYQK